MNTHFQRGQVLFEQSKYELAAKEFMLDLADDPDCSSTHIMIALCLSEMEKYDEALEHAKKAVTLEPDSDLAHRVISGVYIQKDDYKKALSHAEEAIRIDPEDDSNWQSKANVHLGRKDWNDCVDACDKALAINPENVGCRNFKAIALNNLGRKDEAAEVTEGSLQNDPEGSFTHASTGWTCLHRNDPAKALEHFKEALRFNPHNEYARIGLVEALKAKNFIYSLFLRYFLWIGSLKARYQWFFFIGIIVVVNLLNAVSAKRPDLLPYAQGVSMLYFLFVLSAWTASPFFDMLLLFHPEGRYALDKKQKITAWVLALTLAFALITAFYPIMMGASYYFWFFVIPFFLVFPMMTACSSRPGLPRTFTVAYAALMLILLIAVIYFLQFNLLKTYAWGCMLITFIASFVQEK